MSTKAILSFLPAEAQAKKKAAEENQKNPAVNMFVWLVHTESAELLKPIKRNDPAALHEFRKTVNKFIKLCRSWLSTIKTD